MEPRAEPLITAAEQSAFSEMVIAAFGLRRKQMRRVVRTLAGLLPDAADQVLNGAGIDAESRPETLAPGQFASLYRQLANVST
jgi:16S rRNA (adenine1518-N6/adenine1519-N6)-dimethyltransferase